LLEWHFAWADGFEIQKVEFKDLSPTLYPRLLSPRRAKEGANSRIWQTHFTEVLHVEWQWANTSQWRNGLEIKWFPSRQNTLPGGV
jgi:hypothetical protein